MILKGQKFTENLLYALLWCVLFLTPVLSMLIGGETSEGQGYDWRMVTGTWSLLVFFAVTFLVHNFLLAPLLVYDNRRWTYFPLLFVLMTVFQLYQCHERPHMAPDAGRPPMEHMAPQPQHRPANARQIPPPKPRGERNEPPGHPGGSPQQAFGGENMVAFIIMSMLLGLNIGVKHYFKTADDRKRMKDLEYENMHQKLESLTYQINPHFFMNTLNNIHALVAFDPEKAETTIEALSDLMRHVLYEAGKKLVPLQKEIDFIRNYVDIERIRWAEAVRVSLDLPQQVPDVRIPPMLFITFVENAFKHGISYEQPSYVDIAMRIDEDSISFTCHNSRKPAASDSHGGVGLQNAVKRLGLIYGADYQLQIDRDEAEYRVALTIPFNIKL